jgi:hypothetical protein
MRSVIDVSALGALDRESLGSSKLELGSTLAQLAKFTVSVSVKGVPTVTDHVLN